MRYIYCYYFDNGKRYYGQTNKNGLKTRFCCIKQYRTQMVYRAFLKHKYYGEIVCVTCDSLIDFIERYFIEKYKTNNPIYGYNIESGGSNNKVVSEITKEKISKLRRGKHNSVATEFKKGRKYDYSNKWTKESRIKLSNSLKGKHNSPKTEFNHNNSSGKNNLRAYPVFQYNLNGILLAKFDTAKEASEVIGCSRSGICSCRTGLRKTCGGYIWKA